MISKKSYNEKLWRKCSFEKTSIGRASFACCSGYERYFCILGEVCRIRFTFFKGIPWHSQDSKGELLLVLIEDFFASEQVFHVYVHFDVLKLECIDDMLG